MIPLTLIRQSAEIIEKGYHFLYQIVGFRNFKSGTFKVSNQRYQCCPSGILGPPGINNAIYDFGQEWFDLCLKFCAIVRVINRKAWWLHTQTSFQSIS